MKIVLYTNIQYISYMSIHFINKRALGHRVARLRMTVYKGIGKPSSSQSQTINFDRSALSLRLNMGYVDKINRI